MTAHQCQQVTVTGNQPPLTIAYSDTGDADQAIIFLHGLGSDRHDYAQVLTHSDLSRYRLLLLDLPGHGLSSHPKEMTLSVDMIVSILHELVQDMGIRRFHLVGHSLGATIALRFASRHADQITSFVNIEGNLQSEDCRMLSRYSVDNAKNKSESEFFAFMKDRLLAINLPGYKEYAESFLCRPNSKRSWQEYCASLIELSDSGELFEDFLSLNIPRAFVHGDHDPPTYISDLKNAGIDIIKIARSSHWPMYSNPAALYKAIAEFINAISD